MKTKDLWNKYIANPANNKELNFSYAEFEKDVNEIIEFANRWISVEEELPPKEIWLNVKHQLKDSYASCRISGSIDVNFVKSAFTQWRPIEIK